MHLIVLLCLACRTVQVSSTVDAVSDLELAEVQCGEGREVILLQTAAKPGRGPPSTQTGDVDSPEGKALLQRELPVLAKTHENHSRLEDVVLPQIEAEHVVADGERLPCCSQAGQRCDWQEVAPYTIPKCEMDNLVTLLHWLKAEAHVPFHLVFGSLLGSVREAGHIQHETDIDIAVDKSVWQLAAKNITAALGNTGFVFKADDWTTPRLEYSKTNSIHVDIWLYNRGGSETTYLYGGKKRAYVRMENTVMFPLKESCTYNGDSYACPADSQKWLEAYYGKDWQTPRSRNHGGEYKSTYKLPTPETKTKTSASPAKAEPKLGPPSLEA